MEPEEKRANFTEAEAVQDMVLAVLSGVSHSSSLPQDAPVEADLAGDFPFRYLPPGTLERAETDVFLEGDLLSALVRLNPEIAADPDLADEVIYKLRSIVLAVQGDGLVRSNELLAEWLRGEKTMPFGQGGEHVPVRLFDTGNLENNECVVSREVRFRQGANVGRFDAVLFVNGIPLVVGECKTPTREAITWFDGALQIQRYEDELSQFFVPNVFSFATDGRRYRYGSVALPLEKWAPWRTEKEDQNYSSLQWVKKSLTSHLSPAVIFEFLESFTLFASGKDHRRIKIIARSQQYAATKQIVERVREGKERRGLIWHFQGSGKSLLMVFAAQMLRADDSLENPVVVIAVDRVQLNSQIGSQFSAADIPNVVQTESRKELEKLLSSGTRKIIITTIQKFGESDGALNEGDNIILFADEAHRSQEGDFGQKMREALPNAYLFGLTGTPINRRDRNTFRAFGAKGDPDGYMSLYSFEESLRDGATLPLHFETPEIGLRVDQKGVDTAFDEVAGHLTEKDKDVLTKKAAQMSRLVKNPERIKKVVEYISSDYEDRVKPESFGAQVVTIDREACVLYKDALDQILPAECSDIIMSSAPGDPADWKKYRYTKEEEEKILERFRDPNDPLKILIVCDRLLTGFDADLLQTMYLDKPMKDHTLLQAICRTNRPAPNKSFGRVVDFLGIFDDVTETLSFDEKSIQGVISNLDELRKKVKPAVEACLNIFAGVDRSVAGYEGLEAAQAKLPDNKTRDDFAAKFSYLSRLWEALSPDSVLSPYKKDYRWLAQVYNSVKPSGDKGQLLWHSLGAKTIEIIDENIHVGPVVEDLGALVLDEDVLQDIADGKDIKKSTQEIKIKISKRLAKHPNNPKFVALSERLEDLRTRHQAGLVASRDFIENLLKIAEDTAQAEKEIDPAEECRAALTDLFEDVKTEKTPVAIERLVDDIDSIVRIVSFEGWQDTSAGEREVRKALTKVLLRYKLHKDREIANRAYDYIKQYY